VWTFAYDVSGLARVELKYRLDHDGQNPMTDGQNETYAGGPEVGPWQTVPMTFRDFPKGNFFGDPDIDFWALPDYIAAEYYVQVTGLAQVLVDYYVEAEDSVGNLKRSPIQHVWVGPAGGSPSHVMDGQLDSSAVLVASNGDFDLYADWDGEYLYLATQGVGGTSGRDHFVILGVDPATPVAAPWAKAGSVADRTLYLGNEDSNNWCGWFDEFENVLSADVDCLSGPYLEGVMKLETYLGTPLPGEIHLAACGYQSPDGGTLQDQAPAGNGNADIEEAEYAVFPLASSGVDRTNDGDARGERGIMVSAAPNPFMRSTAIGFTAPGDAEISIDIYDVEGRKITCLLRGTAGTGSGSVTWEGTDSRGRHVPPGIYFVRLKSGNETRSGRILLVR
jgi:hypothetical protein